MKLFKSICLLAFFSQLQVIAEIKRNPEVRYGSIQEYRNRQALLEKGTPKSSNQGHHPVSRSDLGFQRPVETKKHGSGYHFGFESKLLHSNNPASAPDSNSIIDSAGIWENALSNNFLLGGKISYLGGFGPNNYLFFSFGGPPTNQWQGLVFWNRLAVHEPNKQSCM